MGPTSRHKTTKIGLITRWNTLRAKKTNYSKKYDKKIEKQNDMEVEIYPNIKLIKSSNIGL